MKILIGCDARTSVERLYCELKHLGVSESVDVYVLSVADVFIISGHTVRSRHSKNDVYLKQVDREIKKAQKIASDITKKLGSHFPTWRFSVQVEGGSPAGQIIKKARELKVDLIILGSHGRIGVGEFFMGSVALKVLSQAHCSVRIVRTNTKENNSPSRFVIAVDGSPQSDMVIDSLMKRKWLQGTSVHLMTILSPVIYTAYISEAKHTYIGSVLTHVPDGSNAKKEWQKKRDKTHMGWIKNMHEEYKLKLQEAGLIVTSFIKKGEPKEIILEESEKWGAECIFVGAIGHSKVERLFMGSVSSAIACRAHCSVEVVRNQNET